MSQERAEVMLEAVVPCDHTGLWLWGALEDPLNCMKGETSSSAKASLHPPETCFLPDNSAGRGLFLLLLPQHCLASPGAMSQGYQGSSPPVKAPVLIGNVNHNPQDQICSSIHL